MNKRLVAYMQGAVLLIEAACMTPALVIALFQQDGDAWALGATMLILIAIGAPLRFLVRPGERNLRAREGFLTVALAWIALSCFGALPFVFSGMIPNYIDALFESVSGFTTTGATVLENFDNLPQGIMFWRSFTHWIGGMGVLVLTLALVPQLSERTSHLVKAESPGPTLSKIVPKMGDTAKIFLHHLPDSHDSGVYRADDCGHEPLRCRDSRDGHGRHRRIQQLRRERRGVCKPGD